MSVSSIFCELILRFSESDEGPSLEPTDPDTEIGKLRVRHAVAFYHVGRCMYPISFLFDSLRNGPRSLHTTFETASECDPALVRGADTISAAKTNGAKFTKPALALLGVGLLSVAAIWRPFSNCAVTSKDNGPPSLICQKMAVSLQRGKLVAGGESACEAANIRCTAAMMEMSQLCRNKCTSRAP